MITSEQINEIAAACAKAQTELKPAVKDAVNPAFRSKYADYAAIIEAAKVYAKHGVAIFQDVQSPERGIAVVTRLVHASGQWIEFGPLSIPLAKPDAHGAGSAITYGKRYALSAALGIAADEDDDGNEAVKLPTATTARNATSDAIPAMYNAWRSKLIVDAKAGTSALEAAWKSGTPSQRDYFQKHEPGGLAGLKQTAANATPIQVLA